MKPLWSGITPATSLISGWGGESLFTSHWILHEKTPTFPTDLEPSHIIYESKECALPAADRNQRGVAFALLPSIHMTRGLPEAFFSSLFWIWTLGDCVLCSLTEVVENSEMLYLRAKTLLSEFLVIQCSLLFFLVTLAPRWQGTNLVHLYTSTQDAGEQCLWIGSFKSQTCSLRFILSNSDIFLSPLPYDTGSLCFLDDISLRQLKKQTWDIPEWK